MYLGVLIIIPIIIPKTLPPMIVEWLLNHNATSDIAKTINKPNPFFFIQHILLPPIIKLSYIYSFTNNPFIAN